MARALAYVNIPDCDKHASGVTYAENYVKYHAPSESYDQLNGIVNPWYWRYLRSSDTYTFVALEGTLPSEALSAFFIGPTFAECGTTLHACIYRAIEEMLGTNEFNRIFNKPLTPFILSGILNLLPTATKSSASDVEGYLGNPVNFLFDTFHDLDTSLTESDVRVGDILCIAGIEGYEYKHPTGNGLAWNLLCTGKNAAGDNLYLGFGPNTFPKPLTYAEVKTVLIQSYNANPSSDSEKLIALREQDKNDLNHANAIKGKALARHQVASDHPIIGITYLMRFIPRELQLFLQMQVLAWHTKPVPTLMDIDKVPKNPIKFVSPFSVEMTGKTFANYQVNNATQQQMLDYAKKFADAVCQNQPEPIGLIYSGTPGVGKSHLSAAIATYAAMQGKDVMFVSAERMRNLYQEMAEKARKAPTTQEMQDIFMPWLMQSDLVILDDIKSEYDAVARWFLQKAIDYVFAAKKALIISSNNPVNYIQKYLPVFIDYNNPWVDNFFVFGNIKAMSHREQWWLTQTHVHSKTSITRNADAIELLAKFNGNHAAGIVIADPEMNINRVKIIYSILDPNKKIRLVREPLLNEFVHDYYVHDAPEHDVFIIKVSDEHHEMQQLFYLLSQIHDLGKKIIVVTNNEASFNVNLNRELSRTLTSEEAERLRDRARILFLKPSDWHTVKLTGSTPSQGLRLHGHFANRGDTIEPMVDHIANEMRHT